MPQERINLGLDLQGGTHLLLEVKVDKAVENNLDRVKADLQRFLREKAISFHSLTGVYRDPESL